MKRLSFGVALLFLLTIIAIAGAQDISKVLLIVSEAKSEDIELMLVKEVGVMIDMLQKAGFKVVVANESGKTIEGPVTKLKPDLKVSETKIDDYAGVIIPCMAPAFRAAEESPVLVSIVKQAAAKEKLLAAADNSVRILAAAGLLDGKRFAFSGDPSKVMRFRADMVFSRSYYGGSGVVQDGNYITSGICPLGEARRGVPDRTAELTRVFIEKLKQKGGK